MERVKITSEYIKLGQLVKYLGLISNGSEAKTFILTSKIAVNGENEDRRGRKLYPDDQISINGIIYLITSNYEN